MKTLFTAEAISKGGRSGTIQPPDGLLDVTLGNPLEKGIGKRDGTLTQVGLPPKPLSVQVGSLIFGRRNFSGSLIGGIKETQEMLDFCGKHNITSDIELIPIQKINEAYDRLVKGDVKYRFVIDMASLKKAL
jgi:uncharacterized zinc-type alcohol dehydrogenase-like protein